CRERTERRDRSPFVSRHLASLLPIGQREAPRREVRSQLRPVDLSPTGHQDEYVVALTAAHDDRAKELLEADPLESGALVGARRSLGSNQDEVETHRGCCAGAGGQIRFHAREPYRVGCPSDGTPLSSGGGT